MKKTFRILCIFATIACCANAFAQSNFQTTVTMHRRDSSQALGRDFWFAPVQNDVDFPSKYIRLFISSPRKTTAFVEVFGKRKDIQIMPYTSAEFDVPLGWELKSSGIVEGKAIHVGSDSADLSVYLISHNSNSSDGMYCIPTIGWGTDYVVAGYESFYDTILGNFDYPSEFTLSANQDNTVIEITPFCDLRQADIYPQNNGVVAYPSNQKFQLVLNRGQSIQFQAVKAQDADNYDVTGTIIHSNVPVGVVAGSMSTNIPPDFPSADYVCDMIPPTRTWGKTYYTTSPFQPPGLTGHDFSLYCLVSSVPNQTIYREDCSTGKHTEAVLGPQFDPYYVEEEGACKWYSDQPFMLVQYINGSTYPDGFNGNADPAEVVMEPTESFAKTILFQVDSSVGSQASYKNFANIIVNNDDANVTLDGKSIDKYTHYCIDGNVQIFVIPNLFAGSHTVKSDLGVGVYVYGYGINETYSWSGSRGVWTNYSKDTTLPLISFSQIKDCIHAAITDIGSGISAIILDTTFNISFFADTISIPGSTDTASFADFCVVDNIHSGYLQFTVFDLAGNRSIGTIEFSPTSSFEGFIVQSIAAFDTVLVGTSKTLGAFLVTDTSRAFSIIIDSLWTDDPAFTIDKSLFENTLPITLNPAGSKIFLVTFSPGVSKTYSANAYAHSSGLVPRSSPIAGIGYTISNVADKPQTEVYVTLEANPAMKSVKLNYSLPQTADVVFELSSMDGKTIFHWIGKSESQGEHMEMLDLSSIAQGDYVYRFEANGGVTSGKLAIVR